MRDAPGPEPGTELWFRASWPRRTRAGLKLCRPGTGAGPELWTDCALAAPVWRSSPKSVRVRAPGPPSVGCPLSVICPGDGRDRRVTRTWPVRGFRCTPGLACLTRRTDPFRRPGTAVLSTVLPGPANPACVGRRWVAIRCFYRAPRDSRDSAVFGASRFARFAIRSTLPAGPSASTRGTAAWRRPSSR